MALQQTNRIGLAAIATAAWLVVACHPGPVINTSGQHVGGTIAGIVGTTDGAAGLSGRKVPAVEVASGVRYDATTGITGGYTIQVPEGTYRLEVETRTGERVIKQPAETRVNNGDLDSARNFEITAGTAAATAGVTGR